MTHTFTYNLQVWHIQNPPAKPLRTPVESVEKAKELLRKLIAADLKDRNVHSNAFGLEQVDENGEWTEWYDEEGRDILQVIDDEDEDALDSASEAK